MVTCSVLIPTYNGEEYLKRALDSVLNQTYKDYEIILIDDGSTDSTPQICDEYEEKYSCIHVIHQKNMGISKTCEKLLDNATGRYVFWLYHDDYLDHTLLEKAVNAFERQSADIVVWGKTVLTIAGSKEVNPIKALGVSQWRREAIWGIQSEAMVYATRRDLWENWERFPQNMEIVDDVWMTSQVVQKAEKIVSLEECLYFNECRNMDSATRAYKARRICQEGLAYYKVIKRNLERYPNEYPLCLYRARVLLINAYCVNQVHSSLNSEQPYQIKSALKDLLALFPIGKIFKRFTIVHFSVIHGINFICHWYGKSRIRKFKQSLGG